MDSFQKALQIKVLTQKFGIGEHKEVQGDGFYEVYLENVRKVLGV